MRLLALRCCTPASADCELDGRHLLDGFWRLGLAGLLMLLVSLPLHQALLTASPLRQLALVTAEGGRGLACWRRSCCGWLRWGWLLAGLGRPSGLRAGVALFYGERHRV